MVWQGDPLVTFKTFKFTATAGDSRMTERQGEELKNEQKRMNIMKTTASFDNSVINSNLHATRHICIIMQLHVGQLPIQFNLNNRKWKIFAEENAFKMSCADSAVSGYHAVHLAFMGGCQGWMGPSLTGTLRSETKQPGYHWYIFNSSPPDKMAAILADDIFKCIFVNEKMYFD